MTRPLAGVVVVNYNGGPLTMRCLESVLALDWPPDRLRVVLVDNASSDGVAADVRDKWPDVDVVVSQVNTGFAGGCNLGIRRLRDAAYVALINNDAAVEPGWLTTLVGALEGDSGVGAAAPKILFAGRFAEVRVEAPTSRPGRGDDRSLGVRVAGARVGGQDVTRQLQAVDGFWGPEFGDADEAFQWTGGSALLRVPWPGENTAAEVRLSADNDKEVTLRSGDGEVRHRVGKIPSWCAVPLHGPPVDVINNAGTQLVADGYGADRGYLEADCGQYDEPGEVFAWCGAGVVLSRPYLDSIGLFDERLFLYYEDLDLAWRGQRNGWRYAYEPGAVVRHVHAAASVEHSDRFDYFVERNHLVVVTKHAPAHLVVSAVIRYLLVTASYGRRDVVAPLLRGARPSPVTVRRRLRAFLAYLRLLPATLVARVRAG